LLTGLVDDDLGVLLDQLLELGVAGQRLLQEWDLLGADVAGEVLAFLPALDLEIRTAEGGPVLQVVRGELAALHELDLGDLGQEVGWIGVVHICTY
jgi:hypothetical protein